MDLEKEKKILEFMSIKDIRSVEVIFEENGEPKMVKVKTVKRVEKNSRLKDNLSSLGFQSLTVKTRNGKIIHTELITIHKLT